MLPYYVVYPDLFFILAMILMWKGHAIRKLDPFKLICTEDGEHVISKE